jgi:hypothetical protein
VQALSSPAADGHLRAAVRITATCLHTEAARHLLGGAAFDVLAMGQLRHQVLGGGPHLGNERAARIV